MMKQSRICHATLLLACCITARLFASQSLAQAQDILRQQPLNQQHGSLAAQLANIQLPPQLASLTPQQLHHLAQLRELQLQREQQQQQQQQQQGSAASPGNQQEQQAPTSQPTTTAANDAQIPQPNAAVADAAAAAVAGNSNGDTNDRHDDGSYNEAGTEMEGIIPASESANSNSAPAASANPAQSQAAPTFEVNWNKCPQLEPSETEKNKKTQVITKCLQSAPIPTNLTRENVEAHREQIATCALKVEGWFNDLGDYKYDKAESEIRSKKLESAIEVQVLKFHLACKDEASKKFPRDQNKLIDQVQFYQACMDYYISIVCEIEVSVDQ